MSKRYKVLFQFEGKSIQYSPEFQTEKKFALGWKTALQKVRYDGVITCSCGGTGDKKLLVRYRKEGDFYYMAKWPSTGPEHARDCIWWSMLSKNSGIKSYQEGVIKESAEGVVTVTLATGLIRQDPKPKNDVIAPRPVKSGTRQTVMSLLGLMHLLWTGSNLNRWYPRMEGKRKIGLIHSLLQSKAQDVKTSGLVLDDVLLLPADKTRGLAENSHKVSAAMQQNHRMVAIATLASHTVEREESGHLPISNFYGFPNLKLSDTAWSQIRKRFPFEMAAWREGEKVIAIAQTDVPEIFNKHPTAQVLQIALMWVSERWIPLDSSYEAVTEKRLHAEGRAFLKPLLFDASEDEVLPDFCLLDTLSDEPVPMEVFGMKTEEYLKRKQEKMAWYNKKYGHLGWWYWDAAYHYNDGLTKPFPAKR